MDWQNFAESGWVAGTINRVQAAQVALMQETVARAWNVPVDEIRSPTRRRAPVAQARQVAMYLTHVLYGFSLSAVGRHFGRDRTTAAHACRLVEDRRDDENFDMLLDRLEHALRRAGAAQALQ
ncbi:helix-turn-helix domain-containing protein [Parvibaculum lavamentivorans]|nr:helix-turn-helix domain-containing protein [Parvibaculum lavamentivorans]